MDTRENLISLLTRLIMDGLITEEDANLIIDAFDRGEGLPQDWQLPLPILEAIPVDISDRVAEMLVFHSQQVSVSPDRAQDEFMREAEKVSRQLAARSIDLAVWHETMLYLIIGYLAEQAQSGAQTELDEERREGIDAAVLVQLAYLSRFADAIATNSLTAKQIEARAALYSGEGRALWYEQNGLTNALFGWVEDYISLDDRRTCGPCGAAEAQGPYLPSQGPMPGRICLGRGYCRCQRLLRYDPEAYLRLSR